MDSIGTGGQGRPAEIDIIVLADGEDRPTGRMCGGDGGQPVVGAGGQVDDDPVDLGQRGFEPRQ